jgi:hypothetical protein
MWEPRRLTTLWASTSCYGGSFTFCLFINPSLGLKTSRSLRLKTRALLLHNIIFPYYTALQLDTCSHECLLRLYVINCLSKSTLKWWIGRSTPHRPPYRGMDRQWSHNTILHDLGVLRDLRMEFGFIDTLYIQLVTTGNTALSLYSHFTVHRYISTGVLNIY